MRRKNKRIAKINQTSSVSGESDTTNLTGPDSESQEIANVPNDEIDCKLDSELSQIESNNTKSDSTEDETTIKQEMTSTESTFLFVELKLISIDYKCVQYSNLIQKFLCINSDACIHHINKFIAKNMNIIDDLFEVCVAFLHFTFLKLI
jgi:hypothetical protein